MTNLARILCVSTILMAATLGISDTAHATTNSAANDGWISIGIPTKNWLGTDGTYYVIGNDHGSCASVTPDYFRVDTTQPKWREFYALVLYAAANQKTFVCKVSSGCGTSQVWVTYCEVPL